MPREVPPSSLDLCILKHGEPPCVTESEWLQVPNLSASMGANSSSEEEKGGNLNLLVIAHCIAKALPDPNEAKDLFSSAFHIPQTFMRFTQR